jgi:acyl-coenzyme A thioesterase PaaI-like protein
VFNEFEDCLESYLTFRAEGDTMPTVLHPQIFLLLRTHPLAKKVHCIFTDQHQVPPGYVHGGASAAVLDEAMGLAIWQAGYRAVTVHLTIDYRQPVPLGESIRIRGVMHSKAERRIETSGEILLPDGSVAVFAKGIYAEGTHFLDLHAIRNFEAKK